MPRCDFPRYHIPPPHSTSAVVWRPVVVVSPVWSPPGCFCRQEEAVRSGKQNAAVEMRWAELLDENMPQELHRHIEEQKTACSEIVASKV